MKANIENLLAYIESLAWNVYCDGNGCVELAQSSPAGEDFSFTVSENNLIEDVKGYAESFDSEEQAAMWYDAGQSGVRGVPSFPELVEDADAIQEMLNDLATNLCAYRTKEEKQMKFKWEIRQIDAIAYDDGWTYNESYHLGVMKTSSKHLHRAFTHWLRNTRGIQFGKGTIRIEDQGDLLEIQERKSGRPLFVAIYQEG